jgi:hypothetical protein
MLKTPRCRDKIAGKEFPTMTSPPSLNGIVFICLAALACDKAKPPEESNAEALAREKAATAARRAKREGTDPESLAKAAKEKAEAPARAEADAYNRASCADLAQQTRDCNAGKPCSQVDPDEMRRCARYMASHNLEKNPF